MIKGLYSAASGMMLGLARQDVLANNLANVNTAGFKKDLVISTAFPDMLINRMERQGSSEDRIKAEQVGSLGSGACVGAIMFDLSQGNLRRTENPLDLALANDDFFVVETPDGQRFTRNGQLQLDSSGMLTDQAGHPILDNNDDQIILEGQFTVDKQGNIIVNGETVATLKIVRFENKSSLLKQGTNLWQSSAEYLDEENPQVLQNYIEDSNVNAVSEMVSMIKVTRAYESLQKVVQAEDESLQTVIEKVGSGR